MHASGKQRLIPGSRTGVTFPGANRSNSTLTSVPPLHRGQRLHQRLPHRTLPARREAVRNRRGHQRDPPTHHRTFFQRHVQIVQSRRAFCCEGQLLAPRGLKPREAATPTGFLLKFPTKRPRLELTKPVPDPRPCRRAAPSGCQSWSPTANISEIFRKKLEDVLRNETEMDR